MSRRVRWLLTVLGLSIVILLLSVVLQRRSAPIHETLPTVIAPVVTGPTDADAQLAILELWKYADKLAPLDLDKHPSATGAAKDTLLAELRAKSYLSYPSRKRKAFRDFRDGILECNANDDRARCMFDLMGRLNVLLADWKLDRRAAENLKDSAFAAYIDRHEEFMTGIVLLRAGDETKSARQPAGCALVYAQLYYLADGLMGAATKGTDSGGDPAARQYMIHATRVGILGVDTSVCRDPTAFTALQSLQAELIDVSSDFGEATWQQTKTSVIIAGLIRTWRDSSITEADYYGTQYEPLADSIGKMRTLLGSGQ